MKKRYAVNPFAPFALAYLSLFTICALVSLFWPQLDANSQVSNDFWAAPSASHILGVDGSGRDIATRLFVSTRVTVLVSLTTMLFGTLLSLLLAAFTIYGKLRGLWIVLIDVLIALPTLLLAMLLTAVFQSGIPVMLSALSIGFGAALSRVVRGELQQALQLDFVTYARTIGVHEWTIFWRHALPYALPVVLTQAALIAGLAALAESSLTYLGFGVDPGVPSLGLMLAQSQQAAAVYPLTVLWPGLALLLWALSCFVCGDMLRQITDPRLRKTQNANSQPAAAITHTGMQTADTQNITAGQLVTALPHTLASDTQPELLRVTDLTVQINGLELVSGVNFTLQPGGSVGFIGASGSGKTVTAKSIALLHDPAFKVSGQVRFHGQNLLELPENARAQLRGAEIAYVFQEPKTALSPLHKLGTQITASLTAHYTLSKAQLRTEAIRLAELVELDTQLLNKYPHEVSGGQRQRAAIAAALAADPKLLIADEITSSLDATIAQEILQLLQRLVKQRNLALIYVSHDLSQIRQLVQHALVFNAGKLVEQAATEQLFTNPKADATRALLNASGLKPGATHTQNPEVLA